MKVLKFYDNNTKTYITPQLSADKIIVDDNGNTLASQLNSVEAKQTTGTEIAVIDGVSIYAPSSGETIIKTIDTYPITYFDTLDDLKDAGDQLTVGSVAATKGYFQSNDGGGSTYYIISDGDDNEVDGVTLIKLADSIYADFKVPVNETFSIRQFGGKNMISKDDCIDNEPAIQRYLAFCTRQNKLFKLCIPSGAWCFSETTISQPAIISGENSNTPSNPGLTIIIPMQSASQDFIFKLQNVSDTSLTDLDFCFGPNVTNYFTYPAAQNFVSGSARASLILDGVTDSRFDGLYFSSVRTALEMNNVHDCYFGFINPRNCGRVSDSGVATNPILLHEDIYNVFMDYFNFEVTKGSYFYGDSTDPDARVQLTINNIQAESTHPNLSDSAYKTYVTNGATDPGYSHSVYYKMFVFDGKIGSEAYPTMVNSISLSNPCSCIPVTVDDEVKYCKFMGLVGNTRGLKSSVILNNVFMEDEKANSYKNGPWYIYDTTSGGKFTFNSCVSKSLMPFYVQGANMPIIATVGKTSGYIYAQDCQPAKVNQINDATYAPHGICGANELSEYYYFTNTAKKQYSMTFYNSDGVTSITPIVSVLSGSTWGSDTTLSSVVVSSTSGWVTVTLPVLSTSAASIRIKNLPKNIAVFY